MKAAKKRVPIYIYSGEFSGYDTNSELIWTELAKYIIGWRKKR